MSHELRTPLNAIIGFSQLIERQNPTESQRARVSHIIGAGRHLLNLINEVLDISRLETGNLPLSLEPVCVAVVRQANAVSSCQSDSDSLKDLPAEGQHVCM